MNKFKILPLSILLTFNIFSQNLDDQLEQVFNDFQLMGMSVWVDRNGEEGLYHYGLKDFTRNLEMDEDTKYRIASVSKSITALGLLKLYDQGLFELNDPINDYLNFTIANPAFPLVDITFKMLLTHTSSIQDGTGYNGFLNATYNQNPVPGLANLLTPGGAFYTANMFRTETPGTYFTYSNLNYGIIATLIEAISNERFDVFMKNQILVPLGITGSYNIQDIEDIDDIAVLYRNQGGWTPQFDNYQGVMPSPPANLPSLVLGTNGLYFSPQGGLRASANELGTIMNFIQSEGSSHTGIISQQTLNEMTAIHWNYNGTNGDNYFDLFNRWGLGLHHANISADDQICFASGFGSFLGHPGEAYGLISDAYFSQTGNMAFSFLTNGSFTGYQFGANSAFYTLEEAVFSVLCDYFNQPLSVAEVSEAAIQAFPNPVKDTLFISGLNGIKTNAKLFDAKGKKVLEKDFEEDAFIQVSELKDGLYFLKLENSSNAHKRTFKIVKK
jgi:CubicO group peptidase (beta-lactamase class C family)